jgi:ribosomal protein S18 acetylase RimI-like enzyme
MYVEPNYRGKGWGQRLLDTAIEFAAQVPGLRQVNISVYSDNEVARRLYISSGFVPYGIEPCAMQDGDTCYDEEHMVRMLARPSR